MKLITTTIMLVALSMNFFAQTPSEKAHDLTLDNLEPIELYDDGTWEYVPVLYNRMISDGGLVKVYANKTWRYKHIMDTLGNRIWNLNNLNVVKFNNGDPIPEAKTRAEWQAAAENKTPAYCNYRGNSNNSSLGKLYNYYALTDPKGVTPNGWMIPNQAMWEDLINEQGGAEIAGKALKASWGWPDYTNVPIANEDIHPNDANLFYALPNGMRIWKEQFTTPLPGKGNKIHPAGYYFEGGQASYWTSTLATVPNTVDSDSVLIYIISDNYDEILTGYVDKGAGFAVRIVSITAVN